MWKHIDDAVPLPHLTSDFITISSTRFLVCYHIIITLLCCLLCLLSLTKRMEKHNPELNCKVLNNINTEMGLTQCDYVDFESINELKPTNNDLSIMQLNIRGLLNKQDRLNEIINECQADAILLCETWLKKQTECLVKESSYKLYSIVRRDKKEGGVGILVHKNLRTRLRPDLHVETKHFEHVVVELKTDTHNILLVSGYRPPHTKEKLFLQEYNKLTKTLEKLKKS